MIALLQTLVYVLFYVAIFALCIWALIDLARRTAGAFAAAGKLTKGRWAAILAVATAVAFVALPYPIGIGQLTFLALGSAVAAAVYLVDVRPALGPHGGRRRPGRGPSSRGGW
ncbi:DUF2516 family protein [Cellulomonas hominis]